MSGYGGRAGALGRLGALAGLVWVVCILIGNGITESGAPTEETPAAAQAYFALQHTGAHRFAIGLELLGFCLMVVFLARLHAVLRDAEGPGGWLATLALSGGLVTVAVKLGSAAFYVVGLSVDDLAGEQARLMIQLGDAAFLVSAMTSGLLVLGAAGSSLRSGVLPRWLAWLGVPIGALAVLGSLSPTSLDGGPGVPGFLLGLLWLAAVSVVIAVRGDAVAPARVIDREAVPARA
jgi:hypothetical protein